MFAYSALEGSIASESTVRADPTGNKERTRSSEGRSRKGTDDDLIEQTHGRDAEEFGAEGVKHKPSLAEEKQEGKDTLSSSGSGESPDGDGISDSKGDESGTNQGAFGRVSHVL